MSSEKIYYSVYTSQEKIWIRADVCEVIDGCLVFSDFDDDGVTKILIASFKADYWNYVYEADPETGESIPEAIPFWKQHKRFEASSHHVSSSDGTYRPRPSFHK